MSTEDFVARGLRSMGLDVQPIPVGATKTPDFRVSDGTQTCLLEVKDKFQDSDSIRRREKALDSGGIWEEETELAYQNALWFRQHRPTRPRSSDAQTRRGRTDLASAAFSHHTGCRPSCSCRGPTRRCSPLSLCPLDGEAYVMTCGRRERRCCRVGVRVPDADRPAPPTTAAGTKALRQAWR